MKICGELTRLWKCMPVFASQDVVEENTIDTLIAIRSPSLCGLS